MNERKTVFITGAASGFGFEAAKRFSRDSKYNPIYATDKNPLIHDIFARNQYERVRTLELDLRRPDRIVAAVDQVLSETGSVDVLINNAGVLNSGRIHTYFDSDGKPTEELRELWETNLRAPLELMLEVLKYMREKKRGIVVNVTSTSEHNRAPHRKVYADYKAVFAGTTRRVAQREAPYNIHVVNVAPGMHKTAIDHDIWTDGNDELEVLAAQKLYDWWRKIFGAHPRNVAEIMYKIAEGQIKDHRVMVGIDAKLTTFLHENIPYWPQMFTAGFYTVLFPIKLGIAISRNGYKNTS